MADDFLNSSGERGGRLIGPEHGVVSGKFFRLEVLKDATFLQYRETAKGQTSADKREAKGFRVASTNIACPSGARVTPSNRDSLISVVELSSGYVWAFNL